MFICLGFIIISTILSFGFKDIYEVKKEDRKRAGFKNTIKEYGHELSYMKTRFGLKPEEYKKEDLEF